MRTRVLWAAAGCASLLALVGCGEIDNCREGEEGCLRGQPLASGECRYDLVLDELTGICIEATDDDGGDDTTDDADDVPDGPPLPNVCGCGVNQVCQAGGTTCVPICEVAGGAVTQKASLLACRNTSKQAAYTFAQAVTAWCQQACTRRAALCGEPCDPSTACGPVAAAALFAQVDPTCMQPECAMRRCEETRDRPCAMQQCLGMMAPNCANLTCTNTCSDGTADGNFNFDGVCDDGDLSNAVSAICAWGSDCGDCGPRRGTPPPATRKLGEQCIDPYQCGASYTDFSSVPGWCVPLDANASIEHCVPDCTNSYRCPEGYDCQALRFSTDGGSQTTLKDDSDRIARACFPTQCGG